MIADTHLFHRTADSPMGLQSGAAYLLTLISERRFWRATQISLAETLRSPGYYSPLDMDSLQGKILIAAPRLADPNFFHTVILMVQHNDEGALGLVLNRPLGATVAEVWTQVSDADCSIEGNVHQGGPCEGPLMVLHSDDAVGDMTVMPGVALTTNKGVIEALVEEGTSAARFFVGYAGWAAGQLEQEIDDASWLLVPAKPDHIFEESDNLWQQLHKQAMRTSHVSWIPPEIMPEDPSLN